MKMILKPHLLSDQGAIQYFPGHTGSTGSDAGPINMRSLMALGWEWLQHLPRAQVESGSLHP